ncbi:condensation domain-containing protein [Pseudoalteromonas piscicida]|uniref:condensation domain-containing protein n=1 Tax=Pseudoalteromonas piscicida TaxID=43662 RepID=UPI0030B5C529
MSRTFEVLQQAKNAGFQLYLEEGELKCKAPKSKLNTHLLSEIKANKEELRSLLQALQSGQKHPIPSGEARDGVPMPLSFGQEELYYHSQLAANSHIYNMPFRVDIKGRLCVDSLCAGFSQIVQRHRILRTRYQFDIKGVFQVSEPFEKVAFEVSKVDLNALSDTEKANRLQQLTQQEALVPFDLSKPLMLRAKLVSLTTDSYTLLVTLHHIAADAWSVSLLLNELRHLYSQLSCGVQVILPEPELHYADYALWQSKTESEKAYQEDKIFWKNHLREIPAPLELGHSSGYPDRGEQSVRVRINEVHCSELRTLARALGVSTYRLAITAFAAALAAKSQREHFVITTNSADRANSQLSSTVGYLVSVIPLKFDLRHSNSWLDLIKNCDALLKQNLSHQNLSYAQIIGTANEDNARDNLEHIKRINFEYVAIDFSQAQWPGVDVTIQPCASECLKQDVNFTFRDDGKTHIGGSFQYQSKAITAETAASIAQCWQEAIAAMLHDVDSSWRLTSAKIRSTDSEACNMGACTPNTLEP